MTQSTILDDKSLMRILLGAVIGGVVTGLVGFSGFGWTFESKAKDMARASANAAVVEALAPICAENFQRGAEATKNKVALMKSSSSDQVTFIEQGGWAKFPGNNSSNNMAVADACIKMISAPK